MTNALLRFITCGSVDDGKSTLIGRLLYDSKLVFEDQLAALDKDSKKFGTQGETLDLALLVDGLAAEREQGITIDVAYRYFATPNRSFIVADTPGHEQYTRNMATGASTAELAIILVDARKGILPQTRRHSFIVSMLGVRHIVVAINKMDLVGFDEGVFNRIRDDYAALVANLGFETITPVPISALNGDNVTTRSDASGWYRGPTLIEHLETIDAAPEGADAGGFRFPVQWVNRPNLDFRGYAGFVAQGSLKPGDAIKVLSSGQTSRIARIVTADGDLPQAITGQAITLTLDDEIDISRGDVLVNPDADLGTASQAMAQILWMGERLSRDAGRYIIKLGTSTANASIADLAHAIDIHTYEPREAAVLRMNEIGLVRISFDKALPVAAYRDDKELGAFILIDRYTNETVALGTISGGALPEATETTTTSNAAQRAGQWASKLIDNASEKPRRSLAKVVTWGAVSGMVTFVLCLVLSRDIGLTAAITLGDLVIKSVLYFLHERAWALSGYGVEKAMDPTSNADGAGI